MFWLAVRDVARELTGTMLAIRMSMAQIQISLSEFNLLKKEIETLGELLSAERVNRQAEVDKLKLEIEVLEQVLDSLLPNFFEQYSEKYKEAVQGVNPEWKKGRAA